MSERKRTAMDSQLITVWLHL